jgi:hypothetical protein
VGRGALESRLAGFNRPLDRLSYRPIPFRDFNKKARCLRHTGPKTPREGCPWPGVTCARDRARASSPTDRRIASLLGNPGCDSDSRPTWTTSMQGMSQADSRRDQPCGSSVVLHTYRRQIPGGCSRDFEENCRVSRSQVEGHRRTEEHLAVKLLPGHFRRSHRGAQAHPTGPEKASALVALLKAGTQRSGGQRCGEERMSRFAHTIHYPLHTNTGVRCADSQAPSFGSKP